MWFASHNIGSSGDLNSPSLYTVQFFVFMGGDGKMIDTIGCGKHQEMPK